MEKEINGFDEIKFALVTENGKLAWDATKPAMYKREEDADKKLARFERLKYYGFRKVRVTFEEMDAPVSTYKGLNIEGVNVRRVGSVLEVVDDKGVAITPRTIYHEIYFNPLANRLIGALGSMKYVLTPTGKPWTKGYQNIYKEKGILYGSLGSLTVRINSGNTNYYGEDEY